MLKVAVGVNVAVVARRIAANINLEGKVLCKC